MGGDYFGFIAAAYGLSALALAGLGAWVFVDARATRRRLSALEKTGIGRRRPGEEAT